MKLIFQYNLRCSLMILGIFNMTLFTNCNFFDRTRQPAVEIDVRKTQLFSETTTFPYVANNDRKIAIVNAADNISEGMSGDQVLRILSPPDDVDVMAHVFDDPYGWYWGYYLQKKARRSPDETDIYLEIIFDKSGHVSKIVKKNLLAK